MQVAVGADVDIGIGGAAGRDRRVPTAVIFELIVAPAAGAGFVGPGLGIGLSIGVGGAIEFVAPNQRSRGNIRCEGLSGDGAIGVSRGCGDGVKGQIRRNQKRRFVDRRGYGGRGTVHGVVDGGAGGGCGQGYDYSAVLRGGGGDGRRSGLRIRGTARRRAFPAGAADGQQEGGGQRAPDPELR